MGHTHRYQFGFKKKIQVKSPSIWSCVPDSVRIRQSGRAGIRGMTDQHPSIKTMVRTVVDGFQISLPTLVKLLIVIGCIGICCLFRVLVLCVLKNFLRNSACIFVQFLIVLGLRELSQILALSSKVKGKAFNFSNSISIAPSLKVVQTSSKAQMYVYGI